MKRQASMKHTKYPLFSGQGLVEYAILIALAVIGVILTLQLTGMTLADLYCNIARAISGSDTCALAREDYCSDDFPTDMSGWNGTTGQWGVANGQLCTAGYGRTFNRCSQETVRSDYVVSLDGANLMRGNGYGVFFRATDVTTRPNGYIFQYDPGYAGGAFIFRKWVDGNELWPPFAVARAQGYDWYNTPRDVKVVVEGNTFTAYVDGVAVLTATDDTYTEGASGLRTWDSTSLCVDGFSTSPLP
jgi:fructan beta-fructosidase